MRHRAQVVLAIAMFMCLTTIVWADFCVKCGENLDTDAKFCKKCGNAVVTLSAPSKESPTQTPSDSNKGKIFLACGYRWIGGPDQETNFNQAQEWILSLGDDWNPPTTEELKELYGSRVRLPFADSEPVIWATPKDSSSAWVINFRSGLGLWRNINQSRGDSHYRAVAIMRGSSGFQRGSRKLFPEE